MLCDCIEAHLGGIPFTFDGIAGNVHGCPESVGKDRGIYGRFVLPSIQNKGMSAMKQCLFIDNSATRSIDDERSGFAEG